MTLLAICLASSLLGQTSPAFTSPSGYITKSGGDSAVNWGLTFWDARTQILNENLPAASTVLLRLEYRSSSVVRYDSGSCWVCQNTRWGKSYTSVRLTFGEAASTFTSTFSTNYLKTGRTVFAARLSTPTLTVGLNKQVWGNTQSLPLKAYLHTGKHDLLMDWVVAGGKLANGYSGSTGLPRPMDSPKRTVPSLWMHPAQMAPTGASYVPAAPVVGVGRCSDPGQALSTADAHGQLSGYLFGDSYFAKARRGMLQLVGMDCFYGAKNKPQIGVLSVGGSDSGIQIGASCNKLHVNLGAVLLLRAITADKFGHSTQYRPRSALVPFQGTWAGAKLMWQCGFENSRTRQLILSKATKIILPKKPVSWTADRMVVRYWTGRAWYPTANDPSRGDVPQMGQVFSPTKGWNRR